jgi:gluconolactonase
VISNDPLRHAEMIPTRWERLDPRFSRVNGDDRVARIASGCRWTEGGVYVPSGRYFLWSDIPNDRLLRWDETTGVTGVFRSPSGYANGHTLDGEGRLVTCEQGNRRVTRTEHNGTVSVLADRWQGRRFNSPNDVVVRSDGSVWFTDPSYGIDSDYEGTMSESEIDGRHVYRIDPATGSCRPVAQDFDQPNGLAFSLDETQLFIVDSSRNHIRLFGVDDEGVLTGGEVVVTGTAGHFDGVRLDSAGRLWAAAGDGVHCYHPDGTLLGKLLLPEIVSNLTFGGLKRNLLFACTSTSIYMLMVNITGAAGVHDRRRLAGVSAP